MRVSVVIATANRAPSLRVTLDALRHQTYTDFEVIVVQGPCEDETPEVLARYAGQVKVASNSERNLCKSRNLGIDLASGDVVAFIDDDGIPEPRWIEDLVAAYDDERVGGAGGLVYDQTGVNLQYRYAVCDRVGRTDFDRQPPFDEFTVPGADPFLYLQGTNMSFRRQALEGIGGFDENIEYIWDESDLALHLIDAGWTLRPLDGAVVHHKMLPSHLRRSKGLVTDPYVPVKNRSYFAVRNGSGHRPMEEIFRSLTEYVDMQRHWAADCEIHGRFTSGEASRFVERVAEGFEAGLLQGMEQPRAGRALAAKDPDAFLPYPVIAPEGERMSLCLVSLDYPPAPMGGIARYTADLARGLAAVGHDVHVVTRSQPPFRLDYEDGVWVHRHPEGERLLPHLDGHPLRDNLAHVTAVWQAVRTVHERFGVDVVAGNVWLAETLLCAVDPRWPTVMTCSTPIRTIASTQPAVAAKSHTAWQVKLEDAALVRAQHLMPVSHANLQTLRAATPAAADVPATVVWHGMVDRAGGPLPPASEDGETEILFVGRLEPRKGIDTLLDAAIELLRERPQARLRIAGADNPYAAEDARSYRERVDERLANEPGIRDRIVFEGEVSDEVLDQLLRDCHIFCAPSRYESFGLMNLEAMMFSRPVVSTTAGGITEVVADGETGVLVGVDDVAALQRALRELVDDPERRARMGAAGRARFEREFDNAVAVARTLAVYRAIAGQGGAVDGEAAVRAGLRDVMRELGDVADPEAATDELLVPHAFPHDYLAAFERLARAPARDFVSGLYDAILQRPAELQGLDTATERLLSGAVTREQFTRELATSDEARMLGVDPRFLDTIGSGVPQELERRVRDAFWRDDATFARLLAGSLLGDDRAAASAPEIVAALANGCDRHDVLRKLVADDEVRARVPGAGKLLEFRFLSPRELHEELLSLSKADDAEFVAGAYRLLLGREPDPAAAGNLARLRSTPRRRVLADIASAPEAASRGIDAVVVDTQAATISSLGQAPQGRVTRIPGLRRARGVGHRVLRDRRVGGLQRSFEQLRAESNELSARTARIVDAQVNQEQAIGRLESQGRSLERLIDELRDEMHRGLRDLEGWLEAIGQRLDGMPSEGTHGAYLGDGKVLVNTVWGGKLLLAADDRSLTPELVANGIYEAPFSRYLLRRLQEGQKAVDIGANMGMHTVLMASRVGDSGHVFAFEPNPRVREFLEENLTLNWIRNRVTVHAAAVADLQGKLTLHVTERYMGNSSLRPLDASYTRDVPSDTVSDIEVEVEPLDARSSELGHVDLVKIDVEGSEHRVLKGMAGMLDRNQIDVVTFEVFKDRMGDEWTPFCDLLRGYENGGWRFNDVNDDGVLKPLRLDDILRVGRSAQVVMTRS
ncbi:FkbM family methyltransferase [Candidatus Solirubrobacter pratensis]|uniref:FkbM family methyltransferase n=1 Tax=Candidatus Solirubrobacter pratensis TaxID=1298857 RepID=UPI00041F70FB|nr:FkbM family methyltransferase [Candidatus Solirubrobacter pratensis]